MRFLDVKNKKIPIESTVPVVFAEWVLGVLRDRRGKLEAREKNLQLLETLTLGGKKELLLISCGNERFLVGAGADSVNTIVRMVTDKRQTIVPNDRDHLCG